MENYAVTYIDIKTFFRGFNKMSFWGIYIHNNIHVFVFYRSLRAHLFAEIERW